MTTLIPNYLADETHPKHLRKTIKKNLGLRDALGRFKIDRRLPCTKRVTVDLVSEDVILFDASCDLEYLEKFERITCKAFTLGDNNNRVLSETGKLKVCNIPKVDTVRDLLCYDGTDYKSGEFVSSILIICECIKLNSEEKKVAEIIATMYQVKDIKILPNMLIDMDSHCSYVLETRAETRWVNTLRKNSGFEIHTHMSVEDEAEVRRRGGKERVIHKRAS